MALHCSDLKIFTGLEHELIMVQIRSSIGIDFQLDNSFLVILSNTTKNLSTIRVHK